MTFELNYLKNHGTHILHQLLLHLFLKLLRALVTLECCLIFTSTFYCTVEGGPGTGKG